MDDLEIFLLPDGGEGGEFRTKIPNFRKTAFQGEYGDALLTRANIVGITHGTLDPDGDPATLLIFEFRFISMHSSRRFTSCNITVTFEDSDGNIESCPEVHRAVPEGAYALNKTTTVRNFKIASNAGVNVGFPPAGANAGIAWEMMEAKNHDNWTRLSGSRKELGKSDKDDAVVWAMEEDASAKTGIPSFLRTAVLLRRESATPFNLLISVRAEVDFSLAKATDIRSLFGKKKVDRVSPVEIDSGISPKLLKVSTIDPKLADLSNMDGLDLGKFADITLVTFL